MAGWDRGREAGEREGEREKEARAGEGSRHQRLKGGGGQGGAGGGQYEGSTSERARAAGHKCLKEKGEPTESDLRCQDTKLRR